MIIIWCWWLKFVNWKRKNWAGYHKIDRYWAIARWSAVNFYPLRFTICQRVSQRFDGGWLQISYRQESTDMEGAKRSNLPVPYASIDIQQFWQKHDRTQRLYEKESKISGDLLGHRTPRIGVTFYHEDWELRIEDQLMHHQFIMSMHPWPYPITTCHLEGLWWLTADQITKDR